MGLPNSSHSLRTRQLDLRGCTEHERPHLRSRTRWHRRSWNLRSLSLSFNTCSRVLTLNVLQVASSAILATIVPLERRPIMFSMFAMTYGLASVIGPLVGGAFTDHVSWRWCFYIKCVSSSHTLATLLTFRLQSSTWRIDHSVYRVLCRGQALRRASGRLYTYLETDSPSRLGRDCVDYRRGDESAVGSAMGWCNEALE